MISTTETHAFFRELDNFMKGMDFDILHENTFFVVRKEQGDAVYSLELTRDDRTENNRASFLIDTNELGNYALPSVLRNMTQEGRENPCKLDMVPFGLVRWLSEKDRDFEESSQFLLRG